LWTKDFLELQPEAVRLVSAGRSVSLVATVLGIPKAGRRMERNIAKVAAAYFAQDRFRGTLGFTP
jgi:hypothetical protein